MNPQHLVLETSTLPIELHSYISLVYIFLNYFSSIFQHYFLEFVCKFFITIAELVYIDGIFKTSKKTSYKKFSLFSLFLLLIIIDPLTNIVEIAHAVGLCFKKSEKILSGVLRILWPLRCCWFLFLLFGILLKVLFDDW